MSLFTAEIRLDAAPIAASSTKSHLYVLSAQGMVYELEKKTLKSIRKTRIESFDSQQLHRYSKAGAVDKDFRLLCAVPKKKYALYLSSLQSRPRIDRSHAGETEVCLMDSAGGLAITGGDDGTVMIRQLSDWELIAQTYPRPDFISALHVSPDMRLLAAGGYDGKLCIHDIQTAMPLKNMKLSDVVEDVCFIKRNHLIALTREGRVHDIKLRGNTSEVVCKERLDQWPSCSALSSDGRFLLVGTREGSLAVLESETAELIGWIPLPYGGVTSITMNRNGFYIGFTSGHFCKTGSAVEEKQLQELLGKKNYKKVSAWIQESPHLLLYECSILLDDAWDEAMQRVMRNMEQGNLKIAQMLLHPFLYLPSRKNRFENLFSHIEELQTFARAVKEKRYAEAMQIAEGKSWLEYTHSYRELSEGWVKLLRYVVSLAEEDAGLYGLKIKKLMTPFLSIRDKQELAKLLTTKPEIFAKVKAFSKESDAEMLLRLVGKYPALLQCASFSYLAERINTLMEEALQMEKERKYPDVIERLNLLQSVGYLADKVAELKDQIIIRQKIREFITEQEYGRAGRLLQENPSVVDSPEYKDFVNCFAAACQKAFGLADNGDIHSLHELFRKFFEMPGCQKKILRYFEKAYLEEIRQALRNKKQGVDWVKVLGVYVRYFGETDRLKRVLEAEKMLSKIPKETRKTPQKLSDLPCSLIGMQ